MFFAQKKKMHSQDDVAGLFHHIRQQLTKRRIMQPIDIFVASPNLYASQCPDDDNCEGRSEAAPELAGPCASTEQKFRWRTSCSQFAPRAWRYCWQGRRCAPNQRV